MIDMFEGLPGYQGSTNQNASNQQTPSAHLPHEVLYSGAFALLKYRLRNGEGLKAESGAMVAMSSTIDIEGKLEGGLLSGLGRMLAGENFFFQTLVARRGPGEVLLAPTTLGSIIPIQLNGNEYNVQKDGFLAGTEQIEVATKMQSLSKGLFSGEGFFILKIRGHGTVFVSSFGMIHPVTLSAGEEILVDNQHLVAWPDNVDYQIEKAAGGWLSSFTSGEGLVCRFRGPGKLYIQTRNPSGFAGWMRSFSQNPRG